MNDLKTSIQNQLQAFQKGSLRGNALALLNTLDYASDKTLDLGGSPEAFLGQFDSRNLLHKDKALYTDWQEVHLLFQLTDEELSGERSLFAETDVKPGLMSSYLFFALKLKGESYPRSKLAQITRQLNRLFPMPVMVLFEYDGKLSIAVINRRRSKKAADKDVLGKVTLIQEISLTTPHRGHLDILTSFAVPELKSKKPINSFDTLHAAWEEVFNVELLNKKFYRELSNWYFWAIQHVHFPFDILEYEQSQLNKNDLFKDKEKLREHDAKNLIRLLTRLLFVWFVKERGLIPEPMFEKEKLESDWLTRFDAKSQNTCYYKAILQNLFFSALNQPVEKREFRKPGQNRNATNLMRYETLFQDPKAFVELLKSVVPFMNGGLFECLDRPHPTLKGPQGGDVILYEDGFSDRKDNALQVPDFLFFGEEQIIDLSDIYGDNKRKKETVRGIIPILNSYKFTIVENTPIEQEIALDPELLGKVFENLLASYNPETRTTARKQTGSFYTPRTIVDYKVDQSLKAYLKKALTTEHTEKENSRPFASIRGSNSPLMPEADADEGLEILFAYTEKEHAFTDTEKHVLIQAIDNCKILDPACGSGAFPMGILHKLEFILDKLDPKNELWRDRQIEKVNATIAAAEQIDDSVIREKTIQELEAQKQDIQEAFAGNELGYGRKLYLIENCIYGVDIQPIATQVSRLRFFISLIVDQKVNAGKENFGIRPLPNLEAKFATADTLIQIEKPDNQLNLFDSKEVQALEKELKKVRHEMFSAKTPKTKNAKRRRDKELREQIATKLTEYGWSDVSARRLAAWDPYDQNATCSFFDPEWMFDLNGFDIVIGNPPYVQIQNFSGQLCQKRWEEQKYQTYAKTGDLYCLFYERGYQLLNDGGILALITSNKWMRAAYGKAMRSFLLNNGELLELIDFGDSTIFEAATTYTNILIWKKTAAPKAPQAPTCYDLKAVYEKQSTLEQMLESAGSSACIFNEDAFVVISPEWSRLKQRVEELGTPLREWDLSINYGIKTGCNEAFIISGKKREELIAEDPRSAEILKPILRGRDIKRYAIQSADLWMIATFPFLRVDIDQYPAVKKYLCEFGKRLEQSGEPGCRKKTSNEWFEVQDTIAYHEEFSKDKLIYAEIVYDSAFYYDPEGYAPEATSFIMTGERVKYLAALLNSRLLTEVFKRFYAGGDLRGNTFRYKKAFLEPLPVPQLDEAATRPFEILVDCVQQAHAHGLQREAEQIEAVIDGLVYDLYFEKELRAASCFITDRIREVVQPFNQNDSEAFKNEYIQTLCDFFRNDKTVRHALVHRKNVYPVNIIVGAG